MENKRITKKDAVILTIGDFAIMLVVGLVFVMTGADHLSRIGTAAAGMQFTTK